ncbi:MAG: DUF2878 domain-containing protein [Proteobacteria bacterium]|nr:DUF2878 domain-containing protein [Pseudomonadota bacterium]
MSALFNFAGYQAVWLVAVLGAGRGLAWPGLLASAAFAGAQLALSATRAADARLVAVALLAGVLIDGALAASGLLTYAAPRPALPPGGAPVWILALWVAFALTLNHSLSWLKGRPGLAVTLGILGGPFAYWGAQRLSGAVSPQAPAWRAGMALAVGWAAAMWFLTRLAARWQPPSTGISSAVSA